LRATNIQDGAIVLDDMVWVPRDVVKPPQWLRGGDVLVATSSGSLDVVGKNALVEESLASDPTAFGAFCAVLRPKPVIEPFWLALYLKTEDYRRWAREEAAGININNLRPSSLGALSIPVPSLEEQRKVIKVVGTLLDHIMSARSDVGRVPDLGRRYFKTLVSSVYAGLAEEYGTQALEAMLVNCDGRRVPLKARDRKKRAGPYPYYGASGQIDSINDYLFDGEYLLVSEDGANLVNRATPVAFIVRGQFWVNNHAHVLQAQNGIDLRFVQHFIESLDLSPLVTGSAQPKLTQRALNAIRIPDVPLEKQRDIVTRIERGVSTVTSLRHDVDRAAHLIERLDQAIVEKIFRGGFIL
jgi:type I restriction enzyme S subunit